MIKYLIVVWAIFFCGVRTYSQAIFYEKLYAATLHDTIEYTVYLPVDWEGWDAQAKHPVLYAINYGMINGDYLAAQVSYFRKARYAMPNNIIVVVNASMERMGYSYETGGLSGEGLQFVRFFKESIIPAVEKKYNASSFRTYIGHSFASSFGNYLFLHEPQMFGGYILLAPEKTGAEHPPFHITQPLKDYYNTHYTFYYVAVGQNDMARRKDYAKEIAQETAQLNSTHFLFAYDSVARANHNNILTLAIEFGLEHIYQYYTPYSGKDEKDVVKDLQSITATIKTMYDIEPEKIFTFYSPFAQEAIDNKDSAGLARVLDYFYNPRLKGWNIMQFATFCLRLQMKEKARYYFEKAIQKIRLDEMGLEIGPANLIACYNHLAFDVYEDAARGWACLLKSLEISKSGNKFAPKDGFAYYNLGKFSALHNFNAQEGLQYLLAYLANGHTQDAYANYYAGKIYMLLKKTSNAKPYLLKAAELDNNNKEAADLLKQIR